MKFSGLITLRDDSDIVASHVVSRHPPRYARGRGSLRARNDGMSFRTGLVIIPSSLCLSLHFHLPVKLPLRLAKGCPKGGVVVFVESNG